MSDRVPTSSQEPLNSSTEAKILSKFEKSTEKERVVNGLKLKLVQCGWRDEMMKLCTEIIREKGIGSVGGMTIEELVAEMKERSLENGNLRVPDEIKASTKEELAAVVKKWT